MTTLFISDLHLGSDRPEKVELFQKLMTGPALNVDSIYILGDIFDDFWVGCDDDSPPNPEIMSILKNYSDQQDTSLNILRGNRDFHLNEQFVEQTGCKLIQDITTITLNNSKILLMHGDQLCTDDTHYQIWRRFITNKFITSLFSLFPLPLRKRISHRVRNTTVNLSKNKPAEIVDVNQDMVLQVMSENNVETLIHGHTHRQALHDFEYQGKKMKRYVLGDWYDKDCVLVHDDTGFRFERIAEYINAQP